MAQVIAFMNLKVNELPDCYFKEQLISFIKNANEADVNVVLTEGGQEDIAMYCGWPDLSQIKEDMVNKIGAEYYCKEVRAPYDVARHGDKFDEKIARLVFPLYKNRLYRR